MRRELERDDQGAILILHRGWRALDPDDNRLIQLGVAVAERQRLRGLVPVRLDRTMLLPTTLLHLEDVGKIGGEVDGQVEARRGADVVVLELDLRPHPLIDGVRHSGVDGRLRDTREFWDLGVGEKTRTTDRAGCHRCERYAVGAQIEAAKEPRFIGIEAFQPAVADPPVESGNEGERPP